MVVPAPGLAPGAELCEASVGDSRASMVGIFAKCSTPAATITFRARTVWPSAGVTS